MITGIPAMVWAAEGDRAIVTAIELIEQRTVKRRPSAVDDGEDEND